jgi:anthranilate synthase component I
VTQAEFDRLAALGYTRIALIAEARADLYTPLAGYLKLAGGPYSYLLESVVGGERLRAELNPLDRHPMLQNFIQGATS